MAARVPTHVPTLAGSICFVGALILHVSCMHLYLKALTLLGLGAFREYLLVLDLNYYTPHMHELSRELGLSYI